jgi:ribosomal protein S18 acetylase RimI-like enzyme
MRKARPDEAEALIREIQAQYAEDMVAHGGFEPEVARGKAEADIPQALSLPTQQLFVVEDDGEPVGHLWLAERDLDGRATLFVYDVFVREEHRGRGLGRQAMLLAEEEARRRGIESITLNVFGGNDVARALYRSLDFDEVYVGMRKKLQ